MIQYLTAAALMVSQAATPAPPDCVSPQQAGDMAVALLPGLLDGVASRCRRHLPERAFLATGAARFSARLREDAAPRRDAAMQVISLIGGAGAPAGLDAEAIFGILSQTVAAAVAQQIQPESCADVDRLALSLSPLSAENISGIVSATLSIVARSEERQRREREAAAAAEAAAAPSDDVNMVMDVQGSEAGAAPRQESRPFPICPA